MSGRCNCAKLREILSGILPNDEAAKMLRDTVEKNCNTNLVALRVSGESGVIYDLTVKALLDARDHLAAVDQEAAQ